MVAISWCSIEQSIMWFGVKWNEGFQTSTTPTKLHWFLEQWYLRLIILQPKFY